VVPLFGDCFCDLDKNKTNLKDEVVVVDQNQYVSKEASKYVEYLDLQETDPIFSSSFLMMIKESFRQNKHFIVAKIQSRGEDKF
jgi:hypothetical protein